ncbi:LysR family transcriptional regulator [uncultured Oxalicibacterium sp.]|uniref:LysR family transcriptional regulator n=1 Tax=uncultured Oxalicibacterium sp. TaxID=1168540 RepID=UPI0025F4D1C5|nr:LysR family transcriptional regulator [uncultured Oxalicibacterium sp.]
MDRLTAMRVFVSVVDEGSQSAAAHRLSLSRPVVSRYLAELEEWAGARLMHRTTRRLSLTAAGEQLLPRCRRMLEEMEEMQGAMRDTEAQPAGLLRITSSTSFGQTYLAAAVADYVKRYPAVHIDMVLLDHAVNLVEERIDLAVRISRDLDPNLIARRFSSCTSVICAAPDYLAQHGTPQRPQQLSLHNCLTHSFYGTSVWHLHGKSDERLVIPVKGNISANDATTLLQAALAGAGIAQLPTFLAAPHLRNGSLQRLLPAYEPQSLSIYGVYSSRKHMPATLRSMLDFLVERFANDPDLEKL